MLSGLNTVKIKREEWARRAEVLNSERIVLSWTAAVRTAMTSLFEFSLGKDRTCLLSRQKVKSHEAPVIGHWIPKPAPGPTASIRGLRVLALLVSWSWLELVFAYLVLKMVLSAPSFYIENVEFGNSVFRYFAL